MKMYKSALNLVFVKYFPEFCNNINTECVPVMFICKKYIQVK